MEWKEKVDGSGRGKGKNQAGYDWPVDQMRQWIEVDGLTQEIVGQKLGVSPKLVHKACKRFGIQCQRRGPRGGAGHPNWEGGRHSDKNGYILVHRPGHPMARSLGSSHKPAYVLEHRLVMAEYLGRMLEPYEVVHHKNADVTDNRIENLELYTSNAQHLRDELTGRCPNWTPDGEQRLRVSRHRGDIQAILMDPTINDEVKQRFRSHHQMSIDIIQPLPFEMDDEPLPQLPDNHPRP